MESLYLKELSRLSLSSRESVEGFQGLNEFKDYLHVERDIEKDFITALISMENTPGGKLIFINGNVGDGKSHLISSAVKKYPEILKNYRIHNDSTESFYPEKTYVETLIEVLQPFKDENIEENCQNLILAINLGVLFNLCENSQFKENFSKLKKLIDESGILENRVDSIPFQKDSLSLFSFTHYGLSEKYLEELFEKILNSSESNPFHRAYLKDIAEGRECVIHKNYIFLRNSQVKKRVRELLMEVIIKNKLLISTREILNFFYDILSQERELYISIFDSPERSSLLNHIKRVDPTGIRNEATDLLVLEFFNRGEDIEKEIRKLYFTYERWEIFRSPIYLQYIEDLHLCQTGDRRRTRKLCDEVIQALFIWKNGKNLKKEGYVVKEHLSSRYLLMKKLLWEMGKISENTKTIPNITLNFLSGEGEKRSLILDYESYSLIKKILSGYFLTEVDMENSLPLLEFWQHLIKRWTLEKSEIYYDVFTGRELEINLELYGDEEDYYIRGRE